MFIFGLIACVTVPAVQKRGISGPWGWVLWKTTFTHQACPFLSNFAEKHLLYHIANFDGGTQCVIWGVICIFVKSTSCCSGCAPSPWTWSVLHITRVFSVSSQYTIHRSLRHLHCLGKVRYCSPRYFHPKNLPSLADGTFPHDEVKLTGHKKLTFGVAKFVLVSTLLFKDYIVNFTHFCQTCYIHIILTICQEATQCLTLWKISLEKFCKNFFPRLYDLYLWLCTFVLFVFKLLTLWQGPMEEQFTKWFTLHKYIWNKNKNKTLTTHQKVNAGQKQNKAKQFYASM